MHDSLHDAQMQECIILRHVWLLSRYIGTNGKQLVQDRGLYLCNRSHPPRKSTVAYFTPIHQPLWYDHANIAHGSTSHSVRDVALEEKDTEGGDKVQLDDLTDQTFH